MIYSIRGLTLAAKNSLVSRPEVDAKIFWDERYRKSKRYLKNWATWDITGLEL